MLLPAQVKQFLGHEDEDVRGFVAEYFSSSNEATAVRAEEVWEQIDKHGPDVAERLVVLLGELEPVAEHAERVIKLLGETKNPYVRHSCWGAIRQVKLEEIESFIRRLPGKLNAVEKRLLEYKLELSKLTFEQLWRDLEKKSQLVDNDAMFCIPDELHMASPIFLEALARYPQAIERAHVEITANRNGERWTELISAKLLGRVKHHAATSTLLQLLTDGSCRYQAQVSDALVSIGSKEVVKGLVERWDESDWFYRFGAIALFARIKREECESACLRYLRENTGDAERHELSQALIGLLSDEGFDEILTLHRRGELDAVLGLDEQLLTPAIILGRDIPEIAEWKAKIEQMNERRATLAAKRQETAHDAKKAKLGASYKGFVSAAKKKKKSRR